MPHFVTSNGQQFKLLQLINRFFLFEVSSLNLDQKSVFVKLSWIFQLDFRTGTQSRNYSKLVETDFYLENASVFISDRCFYGYFY